MSTQSESLKKLEEKRSYMREYMKKRYHEKINECRAYKNSVKCKINHNLPAEDLKEYGMYLSDIYKLRKIREKLPSDLFEKIINEETNDGAV